MLHYKRNNLLHNIYAEVFTDEKDVNIRLAVYSFSYYNRFNTEKTQSASYNQA